MARLYKFHMLLAHSEEIRKYQLSLQNMLAFYEGKQKEIPLCCLKDLCLLKAVLLQLSQPFIILLPTCMTYSIMYGLLKNGLYSYTVMASSSEMKLDTNNSLTLKIICFSMCMYLATSVVVK